MTKFALFVRLHAKPGKEAELEKFLAGALPLAQGETRTPVWFALKFGKGEFGIFDAFADESGRKAHLEGPIAKALMSRAGELLAQSPKIEQVDLIASKVQP
ncbi:MAG: putative quinol monooxygenase [Myxococcales bacterium]